jgi:hypothetical protein
MSPLIAHGENRFTMEGTGVQFAEEARGAVTAMMKHWMENVWYFARGR